MDTKENLARKSELDKETGCILYTAFLNGKGYGKIAINRVKHYVHRVAWELTYGPIPKGMFVCHKCDVRHCVNPEHLFLGTPKANSEDMVNKGRSSRGSKHGASKLTDEQALSIKHDKRLQEVIAQEYGVSQALVSAIQLGKRRQYL